ncbi:hypothetical protein V1T76_09095 [Roseibium sp. FZY0029]|uniref:hypothetical protein n=1 Tax=Roseibium sp. FZY0029 TaxID=3116647 RepID=UPI002EC652FC|nr:hypothetical protein [Roseibium sp. FZY0029]
MPLFKFLAVFLAAWLISGPSEACVSGRGTELRSVLRSEFVFRGELLAAGPIVTLEDGYFEQTLSFRITYSFIGSFSKGDVRDIAFQYPLNPNRRSTGPEPEIQIGEGYTVVLDKLWIPRPMNVDTAAPSPGAPGKSRIVHRWHKFRCGGDGLRLRKNSHDHAKAIWWVFNGARHTPEIRADILTEFLGIDGRF